MKAFVRPLALAAGMAAAVSICQGIAAAEETTMLPHAALAGIEKSWGFAWAELKALESESTALSANEKALIAVGIAAQIPCQYCVWPDSRSAYLAGATDQEIQEAAAMAAIVRH